MPALPSCLIEPIWEQFAALLPERRDEHTLGCHRPRISDRMVFELLINVLVFGAGYRAPLPDPWVISGSLGRVVVGSSRRGRAWPGQRVLRVW